VQTDRDHQDVAPQRDHAYRATGTLKQTLHDLEHAARKARRTADPADIAAVYGLTDAVRRAEEARDTALLDLATASGEDA
jgi:hypothetical protein